MRSAGRLIEEEGEMMRKTKRRNMISKEEYLLGLFSGVDKNTGIKGTRVERKDNWGK